MLGLIVNPIAGLGGPAGLNGSDGADILSRALERGARPGAVARAGRAMRAFAGACPVVTGPGVLGAEAIADGATVEVVAMTVADDASDTRRLAEAMKGRVDLILFAGGDGTARDIAGVVGEAVPILGIPAGVKMHSAIFARNPESAGRGAAEFLKADRARTQRAEVLDIDEAARREGRLSTSLYGVVRTPDAAQVLQGAKAGGGGGLGELDAALGIYVAGMDPDTLYLLGPGTTMAALKARLAGCAGSLLGVDAARGGEIVAANASERDLVALLEGASRARIALSVVGGQGFLLGRGNQQISPRVLRRVGLDNIDVFCASEKLARLSPAVLSVDTGDSRLDAELAGYRPVMTGANKSQVVRIAA